MSDRPTSSVDSAEADAAARVRASVAATAATRTARMWFQFTAADPEWESVLSGQSRLARAMATAVGRWAAFGADLEASGAAQRSGRIDFGRERSLYSRGDWWSLFAPSIGYDGEPGAWEADTRLDGFTTEEPFWVLELVKAVDAAELAGREAVRGTECQRYRATVRFAKAAEGAKRKLWPPTLASAGPTYDGFDLDVWLDDAGRIRRVIAANAASKTRLELFDFGLAEPIDLPRDDEIEAFPDER
jgi:hypothetical protein